jgi:hypothetical protein
VSSVSGQQRPPHGWQAGVGWRERIGWDALVFLACLGMAVARSYPLVRRFGSTFPAGHSDVFAFLWNNWWLHYALSHHLARPYYTEFIFVPFRLDLRLHTIGFLYGLFCAPLFPLLGQIATLNLQVLATFTLNGFFVYRLVRYFTGAALVSALMGILASSLNAINFHIASGRPSCSAFWVAIWAILNFIRFCEQPNWKRSTWLGVSLVATFLADLQMALFGSFWLAILFTYRLVRHRDQILNRRFLIAIAVPFAMSLAAAYVLYLRPLHYDVGYSVPGASEALVYSAGPEFFRHFSYVRSVYGIALMIGFPLALLYARRIPEATPWILGAVLAIVLAMGPVWPGTRIPLPFALFQRLPGMANLRSPYRFQLPAALGALVGIAMLVHSLLGKVGSRPRAAILAGLTGLIVVDPFVLQWGWPFNVRSMPEVPFYENIKKDPGDFVILEVPVGVRHGTDRIGTDGEILTFYQPIHEKRLINGLATRAPYAAMEYYRRSPALMFLAGEPSPPGDIGEDLDQKMAELDIKYVLVHPRMLDAHRLASVLEVIGRSTKLVRVMDAPDLIAFRRKGQNALGPAGPLGTSAASL